MNESADQAGIEVGLGIFPAVKMNKIEKVGFTAGSLKSDHFTSSPSFLSSFPQVTCAAEHLSLLALLLMPFACSNAAAIFSQEGRRFQLRPWCRFDFLVGFNPSSWVIE